MSKSSYINGVLSTRNDYPDHGNPEVLGHTYVDVMNPKVDLVRVFGNCGNKYGLMELRPHHVDRVVVKIFWLLPDAKQDIVNLIQGLQQIVDEMERDVTCE